MHLYKLSYIQDLLMERHDSIDSKFEVNFTRKHIVKATDHPLSNPNVLTLSNLDLLSGRFPVTYLYFYRNNIPNDFKPITESLKISLAATLSYYHPFCGRIVQNPDTNEPEIICDNSGALFVEANINIPLKALNFYNLDNSLRGKLVKIDPDFAFQIQLTYYTCGGISITFTFDHALGDASSFGKFLVSWSEIAQNKPISCTPYHGRRTKLRARSPPSYHPSLDQNFAKCTMEEIMNIPTPKMLLKRLYFIDESSINWLQTLACVDGNVNMSQILL